MLGTGGIGKTRFAIEVARHAQAAGRPVAYVPLDRITQPDQVLPAVADTLRVTGTDDLAAKIATALRGSDLLLVLDNFEHVVAAAPGLSHLVAGAGSDVQVLTTSREALHVHGEHLMVLDPLSTDADGNGDSPATELFWERARAVNPGMRPNGDRAVVAEICRRLDGLPLAIELAAARATLLAPAALLDRLSRGLDTLGAGARDAPDRQRSLRACLEWSVALLDDNERRLFSCLSVFAGGGDLAAVEAVATGVLGEGDVLELMDSLTSKSLLTVNRTPAGARLMMLETVREYAAKLLAASADDEVARRAHAEHYHDALASDPSPWTWPPRTVEGAAALRAELPNARRAMAEMKRQGRLDAYADLAVVVVRVLHQTGRLAEADVYLADVLPWTGLNPLRRIDLLGLQAGEFLPVG